MTKISAELNDMQTKSTILRINKSSSRFLEKINRINKHLSRLNKKKIEKTQINKSEMKEERVLMIPQKYKGL